MALTSHVSSVHDTYCGERWCVVAFHNHYILDPCACALCHYRNVHYFHLTYSVAANSDVLVTHSMLEHQIQLQRMPTPMPYYTKQVE